MNEKDTNTFQPSLMSSDFKIQLAWLAGIIDGEGGIGLNKIDGKKTSTGYIMAPAIQISNTNKLLMDTVSAILGQIGVKKTFCAYFRPKNEKHADEYMVHICRHSDIILLLETLNPYLVSKSEQASLLLEFCHSREGQHRKHMANNSGRFVTTYDGSELVIYEHLKILNKKGKRRGK